MNSYLCMALGFVGGLGVGVGVHPAPPRFGLLSLSFARYSLIRLYSHRIPNDQIPLSLVRTYLDGACHVCPTGPIRLRLPVPRRHRSLGRPTLCR